MKVAFTGASGSGKTTLVKYVAEYYRIPHISGSAGDIKTLEDKRILKEVFDHDVNQGHSRVIIDSALNPQFGVLNQEINQKRRQEIIENNFTFVTDRSPVDNLTYMIAQCGFHKIVDDYYIKRFADKCLTAWNQLSHVIYVKSIQGNKVEVNGSRVSNKWYQLSSDAQFEYWLKNYFMANQAKSGPKVLIIDYWDLSARQRNLVKFLNS